ncbi:MAG: DUF1207 domain-containing protein [Solimonas sp.]
MKRLASLALASSAVLAVPCAYAGYEQWLPEGQLFPALVAPTIEANNYISDVQFDTDASGNINIAMVAVGNDFGFYRRETDRWGAFQIGLFADFQAQFNMNTSNQALVNADYFVGFPITWRHDAWSARLRLFHQSSHLGDEFILSGDAPERENLSYEAADLLLGYDLPSGWRIYAGGIYVLRKQWDALGDLGAQAGAEYASPATNVLRGHWFGALAFKWTQAFDNDPQTKVMAGVRWGGETPEQRSVTLALIAFHGAVPFGQFFDATADFYGFQMLFTP